MARRDSRRGVISLVRVGKFEMVRISGCPNWVRGFKVLITGLRVHLFVKNNVLYCLGVHFQLQKLG